MPLIWMIKNNSAHEALAVDEWGFLCFPRYTLYPLPLARSLSHLITVLAPSASSSHFLRFLQFSKVIAVIVHLPITATDGSLKNLFRCLSGNQWIEKSRTSWEISTVNTQLCTGWPIRSATTKKCKFMDKRVCEISRFFVAPLHVFPLSVCARPCTVLSTNTSSLVHFVHFDLVLPISASFCLGSCKSVRICMACRQHGGAPKSKPT